MSDPFDDAFAAGEAEAAERRREREQREKNAKIYDQQVEPLVRSLMEAVHAKATGFNNNPKNTQPATFPVVGAWPFRVRRPSGDRTPERFVELNFRRDLETLTWSYESSPRPTYIEPTAIESGEHGFEVVGEELRLEGVQTPEQFADMVLNRFIRDCAHDLAAGE